MFLFCGMFNFLFCGSIHVFVFCNDPFFYCGTIYNLWPDFPKIHTPLCWSSKNCRSTTRENFTPSSRWSYFNACLNTWTPSRSEVFCLVVSGRRTMNFCSPCLTPRRVQYCSISSHLPRDVTVCSRMMTCIGHHDS
jgi:hypothetical protein